MTATLHQPVASPRPMGQFPPYPRVVALWMVERPADPLTWSKDWVKAQTALAPPSQD